MSTNQRIKETAEDVPKIAKHYNFEHIPEISFPVIKGTSYLRADNRQIALSVFKDTREVEQFAFGMPCNGETYVGIQYGWVTSYPYSSIYLPQDKIEPVSREETK